MSNKRYIVIENIYHRKGISYSRVNKLEKPVNPQNSRIGFTVLDTIENRHICLSHTERDANDICSAMNKLYERGVTSNG